MLQNAARASLALLLLVFLFPCALVRAWAAEAPASAGEFFRDLERRGPQERGGQSVPGQRNARSRPVNPPGASGASGLPGREISPDEMQKAFPKPLPRSAPSLPLQPEPAPLMPAPVVPVPARPEQTIPDAPPLMQPRGKGIQTAPANAPNQPSSSQNASGKSARATPQTASPSVSGVGAKKQGPPANPDIHTMAGQMLLVGFSGTELQNNAPILEQIRQGRVGGVILLPRNVESPPQVRVLAATLQRAARDGVPLLIAAEQEGGLVQTLPPNKGFEGAPAAAVVGRETPDAVRTVARRMGLEMAALGLNMALAPVADVNLNPLGEEIGKRFRSFSPDAQRVATMAAAFGQGLAAAGVIPCLKYFPGTGNIMDSGIGRNPGLEGPPDMGGTWQHQELVPYTVALREGWPGVVMAASAFHRGMDALYPATLSQRVLTDLLRERLGFQGVILTHDLEALMPLYRLEDALLLAVRAGADIIFLPGGVEASPERVDEAHAMLVRLTREGRIPLDRMRQSWLRIMSLKKRFLYGTGSDAGLSTIQESVR